MNKPNPGSEEAIEKGCTCAVIDNNYGKGVKMVNGVTDFWVSENCPLHGFKTKKQWTNKRK